MYYSLLNLKMISFVLFPQALQPSMSFNISGYWSVELINVADVASQTRNLFCSQELILFLFLYRIVPLVQNGSVEPAVGTFLNR